MIYRMKEGDMMKLCFVYDKENDKYDKLANEIDNYLKENDSKLKVSNLLDENINISKTKNDFYVIFSDSATELKETYEKLKRPKKVMLITENLTVEYVMVCVDLTKHICYSKNSIIDICSRIESAYEKYIEE